MAKIEAMQRRDRLRLAIFSAQMVVIGNRTIPIWLVAAFVFALVLPWSLPASERPSPWSERLLDERLQFDAAQHLDAQALVDRGRILFVGKFTSLDGAGRPLATQAIVPTRRKRPAEHAMQRLAGPDASACVSCHNEPTPGGAGDFVVNAFVSEGFTGADFDSVDRQFSNERGTPHLFGAGLVELLAREMSADLQALRRAALQQARSSGHAVRVQLESKDVDFGTLSAEADGSVDLSEIEGVDADLVVRPFSQKGVISSLRQFSVNALNAHHGIQAVERYGSRWTGDDDFDGDGVGSELLDGDVSALVAFQATLPPPERLRPKSGAWLAAAERGERRFNALGCATCHRPHLPLEHLVFTDPGPGTSAATLRIEDVDAPIALDLSTLLGSDEFIRDDKGRLLVPIFGDLKRHAIADERVAPLGNELLAQRFVARNDFLTAELWGVASTAPYGHRGDMTTLDEVIRAHGGEARFAREAYIDAGEGARDDIVAFLKTLTINP